MARQSAAASRGAARIGAACVAGAAALWGLWPLWVREASSGRVAATMAMAVAGIGGLPLVLAERARGRGALLPRRLRHWWMVAALGVSNAANIWFYFRALDEGPVAPAVLSHYLAPVLVALAAPLVLGERRARRTPLALALALGGTAALLFGAGRGAGAGAAATRHAALLGAASAVFYAGNVLLSKHAARRFGNAEMFAFHALVAAAVLAPATGLPAAAGAWLLPGLGALVSGLAAGVVYYAGLRRIPAERAAVLTYVEPVAAVLFGWAVLGEAPGAAALAGGALVVAGGILVVTADPAR